MATAAADFQHLLKGFWVEIRNEALCALEQLAEQTFKYLKYFQEEILWAQTLAHT